MKLMNSSLFYRTLKSDSSISDVLKSQSTVKNKLKSALTSVKNFFIPHWRGSYSLDSVNKKNNPDQRHSTAIFENQIKRVNTLDNNTSPIDYGRSPTEIAHSKIELDLYKKNLISDLNSLPQNILHPRAEKGIDNRPQMPEKPPRSRQNETIAISAQQFQPLASPTLIKELMSEWANNSEKWKINVV